MHSANKYQLFSTIVLHFAFFLGIQSCKEKHAEITGPTIGQISIVCDAHLSELIAQEEQIFERTYPYAQLDITYADEFTMFSRFLKDSTQVIITAREISHEEMASFHQRKIYPKLYPFATGAIAFIQKDGNPDSNFLYTDFLNTLRDTNRQFVIENTRSGIANQLRHLLQTETLPKNYFALDGKNAILRHVSEHGNAIGIIDWTDISDSDGRYAKEFLGKIDLIGIGNPKHEEIAAYYRPYQYHLQDSTYPFVRQWSIISATGMHDVGTGFAFFLSGEIGQKIILKAGLLPKFQTERWIELRNIAEPNITK